MSWLLLLLLWLLTFLFLVNRNSCKVNRNLAVQQDVSGKVRDHAVSYRSGDVLSDSETH